jgi:hypothetical protein
MVTYEAACVQVLKKKVRAGKNPRLKLLCHCPSPQPLLLLLLLLLPPPPPRMREQQHPL